MKTGIEKAVGDSQVKSVVIIGKGRTFPAGADIREFGKPSRGIKERERERERMLKIEFRNVPPYKLAVFRKISCT